MIMKPKIDYTLYLVTDRDLMSTETIEEAVELARRLCEEENLPRSEAAKRAAALTGFRKNEIYPRM